MSARTQSESLKNWLKERNLYKAQQHHEKPHPEGNAKQRAKAKWLAKLQSYEQ